MLVFPGRHHELRVQYAVLSRSETTSVPRKTPAARRGLLVTASLVQLVVTMALSALGWGRLSPLLAEPARAAFVAVVIAVTLVALASPVNLSSGVREDPAGRRPIVAAALGTAVLAWLMPFMDRRDLWTIDGALARWTGVALLVAGCVLRVWPMFVLGNRFSGLVALQTDHELVTEGPYRLVRNPSYLGMMLGMLGWALVFRSSVGVVATVRFGDRYADYRRRTWRLVPGVY